MTTCGSCAQGIEMYQGRDRTIRVTLTTSSGTALDLTSAKAWFSVKKEKSDADDAAIILKKNAAAGGADDQILITDATNGILEVYIAAADTSDEDPGEYWYDLVIENSSSKKLQAISPSTFSLLEAVTKAEAAP